MLKRTLCSIIILFIAGICVLSAEESEYYYFNAPILRIFAGKEGYCVVYRTSGVKTERAYLPEKWFTAEGEGKGKFIRLHPGIEPYMSVFYKEGEFSHVKVCVPERFKDPVWAQLPPGDYSSQFDVETVEVFKRKSE